MPKTVFSEQNKRYSDLRNRPFLVVNTIQRPQTGVNTNKAGWADEQGNWAIFENPYLVDRVSAKVMREATVIIDVLGSRAVKNRFDTVKEEEVVTHYVEKYKEQVKEAMDIWLTRMSRRIAADPTLNPSDMVANIRKNMPQTLTSESPITPGEYVVDADAPAEA